MKEAVEDGSFQNVLRSLAVVHNATQLLEGICESISLTSSIISPESSSNHHKSQIVNDGAVAGIVVGCFMTVIFLYLFLYFFARYLDERNQRF
jgi:hypothetical protein